MEQPGLEQVPTWDVSIASGVSSTTHCGTRHCHFFLFVAGILVHCLIQSPTKAQSHCSLWFAAALLIYLLLGLREHYPFNLGMQALEDFRSTFTQKADLVNLLTLQIPQSHDTLLCSSLRMHWERGSSII